MIAAPLLLFSSYPKWVRPLAVLHAADLYGYARNGMVAATEPARKGAEVVVVSSSGRVVSRTRLKADQELRGLDEWSRPVIVHRKAYSSNEPSTPRTERYGDIAFTDLGRSGYRLEGRVSGSKALNIVSAIAPLPQRAEIVYTGGSLDYITHLAGKELVTRTEIRPRFGALTLKLTSVDYSIAAVSDDEVVLFLDPESLPRPFIADVPRLGLRYVVGSLEVQEKLLAVLSLRTGECAPLLRMQQVDETMAIMTPTTKTLAPFRPGRCLVSYDDQLIEIDTRPENRPQYRYRLPLNSDEARLRS